MGFVGGTFLFGLLAAGLAAAVTFVSKPSHQGMHHILCGTAVFCCWLLWALIYVAQTHPLVRPVLQS